MRIAVGSDHAGFELKEQVKGLLSAEGHEVYDVGTNSAESADYPAYAEPAARMVASGEVERGVLVCGSGVGVCIVANKVEGIRAVNAHDADEASMARQHNDVNVLTLGARRVSEGDAKSIIDTFLTTDFEGGRHARRVALIEAVEGH